MDRNVGSGVIGRCPTDGVEFGIEVSLLKCGFESHLLAYF